MFSDDFKNLQFGKFTLLKIETILDITGLEKVKFSRKLGHLIGPRAETEKLKMNKTQIRLVAF